MCNHTVMFLSHLKAIRLHYTIYVAFSLLKNLTAVELDDFHALKYQLPVLFLSTVRCNELIEVKFNKRVVWRVTVCYIQFNKQCLYLYFPVVKGLQDFLHDTLLKLLPYSCRTRQFSDIEIPVTSPFSVDS